MFVDLEISKMGGIFGKKNLWIAPSLGDWLAMGRDVKYMAMHKLGKIKFKFTGDGLAYRFGDGEIRHLFGKKNKGYANKDN